MESTKAAPKIGDIQVLRGVAILLVLGYHLSLSRTLFELMPIKLVVPGWVGVELFFVISGLVVTQSVLRTRPTAGVFLLKRAFRLFPAILLFLGVVRLRDW